jgi:hypothetical protein
MAPEFSRSHLQGLVEGGHVRVDGATAHPPRGASCVVGQVVQWTWCPPKRAWPSARRRWRCILYEDDTCWCWTSRPAWWCTRRAGNWQGTLLNGLLARTMRRRALPRAGIVHRLDKDTSGVMVVGKTLPAVTALVRDIAAREVHRQYLALAHWGARSNRSFERIDAPIGRDPHSACAWPWWPVAGRRAPTSSAWPCATASAPCAAGCTPAARTRSACTWRTAATRWWPTPLYGGRRRWACSARPARHAACGWRTPSRAGEPGVRLPAAARLCRRLGRSGPGLIAASPPCAPALQCGPAPTALPAPRPECRACLKRSPVPAGRTVPPTPRPRAALAPRGPRFCGHR